MAGESGADAMGPPPPCAGGSSFPNAKPSAGASLTPETTKPNSSIVFTPGPERDASAASLAFRSAPILPRRVRTEVDPCPCAGAVSAPNGVGDAGTEATGSWLGLGGSVSPNASPSDGKLLLPATAFISL